VKNEPEFQYMGYNGYSDMEVIQNLHKVVYNQPYPRWYASISNYIPSKGEAFGLLPMSADPSTWEVLSNKDRKVLTNDDAFLAEKQRSKV
jgi:hypothetical protein